MVTWKAASYPPTVSAALYLLSWAERDIDMYKLKSVLNDLQLDHIRAMKYLSQAAMSCGASDKTVSEKLGDYLCELERLCVKSRTVLDGYLVDEDLPRMSDGTAIDIAGSVELTNEGWLHITLNTLLPNCRRKNSGYIGDTVSRLIKNCGFELPYFEKAFMAIVEYCNEKNHNALDNDNKGWKMIPNALKGAVIEDDSQFVLSIGLFSKHSDIPRCEIYLLPPEESPEFMAKLTENGA